MIKPIFSICECFLIFLHKKTTVFILLTSRNDVTAFCFFLCSKNNVLSLLLWRH